MTDVELLKYNQKGFIPGPGESEENFYRRIKDAENFFNAPPQDLEVESRVLPSHWDWVREHLYELYDFRPESLFAYYSNRKLAPWQGAASWIIGTDVGLLCAVQLRKGLSKGRYLKLYSREEILAHEAVHAARSAFNEPVNEEFFAYFTSEKKWRRALGPIVQRPMEVWLFLLFAAYSSFFGSFLLLAGLLFLGFFRLAFRHRRLQKAIKTLSSQVSSPRIQRAILLRLTDQEIQTLSQGKQLQSDGSLRFRIIQYYFTQSQPAV